MKIGSLCSGYGGLDMGLQSVIGGEIAWHFEYEKAPSKILEDHYPNVPNYGDLTKANWDKIEPVDWITAGYPCQPFSTAGQRKGTNDPRHIWPYIKDAIRILRPKGILLENVAGHLTLGFGTVLGDLAELGYDAKWTCIRAADVGAPHSRKRLFIFAHPNGEGLQRRNDATSISDRTWSRSIAGGNSHAANSSRRGWDESKHEPSNISTSDQQGTATVLDGHCANAAAADVAWGKYEPAIRAWESVTRPAPAPTVPGRSGRPRLNAEFVEWMMGLPEGHVTGHGLRSAQEIKMLGNGVVPQQAALALRLMGVTA